MWEWREKKKSEQEQHREGFTQICNFNVLYRVQPKANGKEQVIPQKTS